MNIRLQKELTSRIAGIGVYVPGRKITNNDVLDLLKIQSAPYLSSGEIKDIVSISRKRLQKAGNRIRYWCDENEYCTDIAYKASIKALRDARKSPEEIDMIIFTGMSKAFVEPSSGHVVRHLLGAKNANVIDTQDACTSFIKSMELANSLIKSGSYKNILITAGERTFDWADFTCKTVDELAWKFGSLTIGDAAGAVILEATDNTRYTKDPHHMKFSYVLSDGTYHLCTIGLNHSLGERYHLYTHTPDLFKAVYLVTKECVDSFFSQKEWNDLTYDNLFYHDVGKLGQSVINSLLKDLGVKVTHKKSAYYSEYANVASAGLPLSIWRVKNQGNLKRGNLMACIIPASGAQCGIMVLRY